MSQLNITPTMTVFELLEMISQQLIDNNSPGMTFSIGGADKDQAFVMTFDVSLAQLGAPTNVTKH